MIVIPGQSNPPHLFPGMEITRSMLQEGFVGYSISLFEVLQALGVFGVVGLAFLLGLKLLPLAPTEARALEPCPERTRRLAAFAEAAGVTDDHTRPSG